LSAGPPPLPVVTRFRTVRLERQIVLLGGVRRPEKHVLALSLSKGAAAKLSKICREIADTMPDNPGTLCPFVLSGILMESNEARWILKKDAEAQKPGAPA
jgi:hypothetical protein